MTWKRAKKKVKKFVEQINVFYKLQNYITQQLRFFIIVVLIQRVVECLSEHTS